MALRNIKLTIQYDGNGYSGWQIQPGKKTVQAELIEAISNLIGWRVRVTGASRTDARVSALGQVALIQIDSPIPTANYAKAINDRLPDDITITEAVEVPMGFDIIGDVKCKLYRYTIYTGKSRPALDIKHCWHVPHKLNVDLMNQAAQLLVGTKDFKSFASADDKRGDTVRTIFRCDVYSSCVVRDALASAERGEAGSCDQITQYAIRNTRDSNDWIFIDVEGNAFLYNMVRNIVGSLVEIGRGHWQPDKIEKILEAKKRTAAGPIAPAQGLCLMWIKY